MTSYVLPYSVYTGRGEFVNMKITVGYEFGFDLWGLFG
jgi:hypothetical protein